MSQSFNELLARAAAAADPRITPERHSGPPSIDGGASGFSEPGVSSAIARLLVPHKSESEEVIPDSPASPAESQRAGFTVRTAFADSSHAPERVQVQAASFARRIEDSEHDPNLQTVPRLTKVPRRREDGHISMQTMLGSQPAADSFARPVSRIPHRHVVYVPESTINQPTPGMGAVHHTLAGYSGEPHLINGPGASNNNQAQLQYAARPQTEEGLRKLKNSFDLFVKRAEKRDERQCKILELLTNKLSNLEEVVHRRKEDVDGDTSEESSVEDLHEQLIDAETVERPKKRRITEMTDQQQQQHPAGYKPPRLGKNKNLIFSENQASPTYPMHAFSHNMVPSELKPHPQHFTDGTQNVHTVGSIMNLPHNGGYSSCMKTLQQIKTKKTPVPLAITLFKNILTLFTITNPREKIQLAVGFFDEKLVQRYLESSAELNFVELEKFLLEESDSAIECFKSNSFTVGDPDSLDLAIDLARSASKNSQDDIAKANLLQACPAGLKRQLRGFLHLPFRTFSRVLRDLTGGLEHSPDQSIRNNSQYRAFPNNGPYRNHNSPNNFNNNNYKYSNNNNHSYKTPQSSSYYESRRQNFTPNHEPNRHFDRRDNSHYNRPRENYPPTNTRFHNNNNQYQTPDLCFFHARFGERAHRCDGPPCKRYNEKPEPQKN